MNNKEFSKLLEERTRGFASRVIKLSSQLPETPESKVIRYQLSKSGSSIGANYREANRARSRADFASKISICEAEASETIYWLELIHGNNWVKKEEVEVNLKEASELLAIFTSISNSLRKKQLIRSLKLTLVTKKSTPRGALFFCNFSNS